MTTDTRFDPPWLTIARAELGQREVPGAGDNPRIREYHAVTAAGPAPDSVPWCASFVCFCLEKAGIKHPRSKSSHAFKTWGVPMPLAIPGAVAVFDHGDGTGHVGFVVGKTPAGLIVVAGGNQSNMAKLSAYRTDRLFGYRWPDTPIVEIAASAGESTR